MYFFSEILSKFVFNFHQSLSKYGRRAIIALVLLSFWIGYAGMYFCEPAGSPLRELGSYSWYWIVSSSTAGYGDIAPSSCGGRWSGAFIITSGIASFGILLTLITGLFVKFTEKIKKGMMDWNMKNHIVIIGYHPGRTETIVKQILADRMREPSPILLICSHDQCNEIPLIEGVSGIRGTIDSDDVMIRSNVAKAKKIIIDVGDDALTLAVGLAVRSFNQTSHVVAGLHDLEMGGKRLSRISTDIPIEAVLWQDYKLMVQAMQDPGISCLISILTDNTTGHEFYRGSLPDGWTGKTFGELFTHLKQHFDATVLGLYNDCDGTILENPPWDLGLSRHDGYFYIASERINPGKTC